MTFLLAPTVGRVTPSAATKLFVVGILILDFAHPGEYGDSLIREREGHPRRGGSA